MTYVISDIHGYYDYFIEMLEKIGFNEGDKLYIIGDVVDRGPEPIKLLKYCMGDSRIVLLKGNHESMMYNALIKGGRSFDLWIGNGGGITNSAYLEENEVSKGIIKEYLCNLPIEVELEVGGKKYLLVHANYKGEGRYAYGYSDEDIRLWCRVGRYSSGPKDKVVIVGHTPTLMLTGKSEIMRGPNLYNIDCGLAGMRSYKGIKLGCMRLEDLQEYYVQCN